MQWDYNSFSLPLLVTALIAAALAIFAWRRRAIPGATAFIVLMSAVADWSLGYALETVSATLSAKLFWAQVEYFGITIGPVAWLAFSFQYTGLRRWLTFRRLALLAVMPIITISLVWTNHLHGLIWSSIHLDQSGIEPGLGLRYGAGFWLHTFYSYFLVATGTLLLLRFYQRAHKLYRQQIRIVLIAMFVPWVSNAIYIFRYNPVPSLDLTPFAFTITGLLLAWGFLRLQFLGIVPMARSAIVENMRDAVIVMDAWNRIADINPAAEAIIKQELSQLVGRPANKVFAAYPEMVKRFESATEAHEVLVGGDPLNPVFFDLRITSLYDRYGKFTGRLVILQDITEQELARRTLQKSHAELDLRVKERTAELNATNQNLQNEIRVRKAAEQALLDRFEMERLVSNISTRFINLMVDEIDEEINRSLQTIGEFAGVEYSYVFRISSNGQKIAKTHEWSASGVPLQKDNLEIPCASLRWWMGRLDRREDILIPLHATLPMAARQEKELLRSRDVHSLVAVPLVHSNTLIGFLGFDSTQREKVWTKEDRVLLRMVGETFANAFARKSAEEALRASDAELRAVFAAMDDQVLICDHTGRILNIPTSHPASQRLSPEELAGKTFGEILDTRTATSVTEHIRQALATQKTAAVDFNLKVGDQELWFSGSISPIEKDRVVLVARDITERKASEDQLVYKALHDALTGLPNRRLFNDRLERALKRIKRHSEKLAAVLYLDLDNFKSINDSLGHLVGDKLLIAIAHRLNVYLRSTDTAARLGGDEFAILLEDIQGIEEAIQIADRIQKKMSLPIEIEGQPVTTGASIGTVSITASYNNVEEILRDADAAMYRAKTNGKGRYEVFTLDMQSEDNSYLEFSADLHRAVEQG